MSLLINFFKTRSQNLELKKGELPAVFLKCLDKEWKCFRTYLSHISSICMGAISAYKDNPQNCPNLKKIGMELTLSF